MTLAVLYEDDDLIAVNKPAGMVVHPTYRNRSGTLLDAIRSYGSDWPDCSNPTIVGRLDRDTSGVVLAAKSSDVHALLQHTLSSPDSVKEYIAIVCGMVEEEAGKIDFPLRADPLDRRRVIVASAGEGRRCETEFQRLAAVNGFNILRCRLRTGRRHQIRAHLAARGWPVVGDGLYGRPLAGFARHALHAARTSFTHPLTHRRLSIAAPLPAAMQRLMQPFEPMTFERL